MTDGERAAKFRAVTASAADRLHRLLEKSRTPKGPVRMNSAAEDEIASIQAALELALRDDEEDAKEQKSSE